MTAIRKILALLLIFTMVLASTGTLAAASASDLNGHWAQTYMESLVERKMISGYTDGTMRPDKEITGAEALVFLSHFYELNATEKNAVYEDYGDAAEAITATVWVQSPLAVCLASGITVYSEAKALNLSEPISKEQLSLFLVRAMQMESTAAALEETELTFADKDAVGAEYKGSVALLSQLGIVTGNTKGEFCPQSNVTRAVVATMVCKILDYLEDEDVTLKLAGYTGLSLAEGVLTDVTATGVTLRDNSGIYRSFKRAAALSATVDGKSIALDEDYEGAYAKLRLMEGKVTAVAVTDPEDETWLQGTLDGVYTKTSKVSVYKLEEDDAESYDVSRATIYIDDEEDTLANLKAGCYVNLKDNGKRITELRAYTEEFTINGEIASISYGTTTVIGLHVEDDPGVELRLAISSLPVIKRGSMKVSADKLVVGDVIEAEFSGGEVDSIVVKVNTVTNRGTITSVLTSADSVGWVLALEDGSSSTYTLAKNVVAYEGKKTIDFNTLTFGDEVSFVVQDESIISVTLEKRHEGTTAQSADLSLEVLYVNSKDKIVACKDEKGSLIFMLCNTTTTIMDSASGKSISVGSLSTGDKLLVWGTYDKDGQLVASIVIRK